MNLFDICDRTVMPIAYRLGFIMNVYREPIIRQFEAEFGLIRPEWTILLCLAEQDGLTARDICDMTGLLRNAISRGVALLEKKGLITRQSDRADGRLMRLSMTDDGQAIFARIEPILQAREAALLSVIPEAERERFRGYLDLLCRQVQEMA
ncbi:MAG: MarR family transcriptional regulator [Sneathiellaceae bacterium]